MAHPMGESKQGCLRVDFDRRLKLEFHGSKVTTDAGLLAYRELDASVELTEMAGDVLADSRTGKNGRHGMVGQFRQSVFGRLGGYDDVNDADRLGRDPAMRWIIGGRLAIPIRDENGVLLGYCGRYLGDTSADDVPKYVLPKHFRKELVVYGLAEMKERWLVDGRNEQALFIAESYLSVIKHGHHVPMISMMGRSISPQQIELIKDLPFRAMVAVADGDEPGQNGARDIAGALAKCRWARVVDMPKGEKPHHLTPEDLHEYLSKEITIKK